MSWVNKVTLLKNLYTCVLPSEKQHTSTVSTIHLGKVVAVEQIQFPEEYEVHLVNDSEFDIERVEALISGDTSAYEDRVISTNTVAWDLGRLDHKKALRLETLDFGMLDFVNHYLLEMWLENNRSLQIQFSFKYLNDKWFQEIPVLNKRGYNIEFDLQDGAHVRDRAVVKQRGTL